mmetsp:Transcript_37477/g.95783  ORF Transcript_37477/g.95783 Transcript_37477/m.95783 type:complete len:211 (-) Transcript_37477:391-1023(-)
MQSVSNLKSVSSKSALKSWGISSASWRQHRILLARAPWSGTWWYSPTLSSSSASFWFRGTRSPGVIHCINTSQILALSSFISHSSSNIRGLESTRSLPWPLEVPSQSAQRGLLRGYASWPVLRRGMAGFCTLRVAPYGMTKPRPLATSCAAARPPVASSDAVMSAPPLPPPAFAWRVISLFSTPLRTKTSLGCRYLWYTVRTAQSGLTNI